MDMEESGVTKQVRDLAEGFSTQSKIANRYWAMLIAVAVLILIPDVSLDESGKKVLPFGIGKTDQNIFDVLSFFVLSIITIAFSSARAQAMLAYEYAHKEIDILEEKSKQGVGKIEGNNYVSQRKYFDILATPLLIRLGSLAILAKPSLNSRKYFKKGIQFYYLLMKHTALLIFLLIPFVSVMYGWWQVYDNDRIHFLIRIVATIVCIPTIIPLLQTWFVDACRAQFISKRIIRAS